MNKLIKTETDHEEALARLEELMLANPDEGEAEADELELLAHLIEIYESKVVNMKSIRLTPKVTHRVPTNKTMSKPQENSTRDSVEVYRLVRCLSALAQESEAVFKYLEKIEPYEAHEMSPDTPTPDGYWIALENAKKILSANAKLNRRSDDGTN